MPPTKGRLLTGAVLPGEDVPLPDAVLTAGVVMSVEDPPGKEAADCPGMDGPPTVTSAGGDR